MSVWNRTWYGPVAAIRPYLFAKCFLLMVACDVLVLMTERGARYGADGFNVAHFQWLDDVQPIPTSTWYVGVLMLTSFLAFFLALHGPNRVFAAMLALLYTYAWAISQLDTFQHHYLISLVLCSMVFFPRIRARDIYEAVMAEGEQNQIAKRRREWRRRSVARGGRYVAAILIGAVAYRVSLGRAVDLSVTGRWLAMSVFAIYLAGLTWFRLRSSGLEAGPRTSAWAFRLLGATVGVVYIYAAVAKMDSEWFSGHALRQVGSTAIVLQPVETAAGRLGVSRDWFWSVLATAVIPLELAIAASYFLAIRQDEWTRRWIPRWSAVAWALAVGLHLNNEMMNLILQWFSYYMILLATCFLLPERVLLSLGTVAWWPSYQLQIRWSAWRDTSSPRQALAALGLATCSALVILIGTGTYIGLPGALWAFPLLAVLLSAIVITGMVSGAVRQMTGVATAASLAGLLMAATVAQSTMRYNYHDLSGTVLLRLGAHGAALTAFEKATSFSPPSVTAESDLYCNLGLVHRHLNNYPDALRCYQKALAIQSSSFLAHYNLANMYRDLQRYADAIQHYGLAINIKPDFSDAHVNLGLVLEKEGNIPAAINHYREALRIEPHADEIEEHLQKLLGDRSGPLEDQP